MTLEGKAKAYDEALEKAKFYHGNCPSEPERKKLEKMFPVLRESEDEIIRKAIVGLIEELQRSDEYFAGVSLKDMLIYLEKQKEQKPTQTNAEKEYICTIKSLISDFLRGKHEIDTAYYQQIYDWLDGRHVEQKPAEWSRQSIINALTKWLTEKISPLHKKSLDGTITEREEMFEAALLEMRSLVNSPDFQIGKDTSAGWSEEDESCWNLIWDILDGQFTASKEGYKKVADWFLKNCPKGTKSLRPSWKPSEHQMNILKAVKEYVGRGSGYWGEGLGSLIEDLEKLI